MSRCSEIENHLLRALSYAGEDAGRCLYGKSIDGYARIIDLCSDLMDACRAIVGDARGDASDPSDPQDAGNAKDGDARHVRRLASRMESMADRMDRMCRKMDGYDEMIASVSMTAAKYNRFQYYLDECAAKGMIGPEIVEDMAGVQRRPSYEDAVHPDELDEFDASDAGHDDPMHDGVSGMVSDPGHGAADGTFDASDAICSEKPDEGPDGKFKDPIARDGGPGESDGDASMTDSQRELLEWAGDKIGGCGAVFHESEFDAILDRIMSDIGSGFSDVGQYYRAIADWHGARYVENPMPDGTGRRYRDDQIPTWLACLIIHMRTEHSGRFSGVGHEMFDWRKYLKSQGGRVPYGCPQFMTVGGVCDAKFTVDDIRECLHVWNRLCDDVDSAAASMGMRTRLDRGVMDGVIRSIIDGSAKRKRPKKRIYRYSREDGGGKSFDN